MHSSAYFLGFDFGTSGARAMVIDRHTKLIAQSHCAYAIHDTQSWLQALVTLCAGLPSAVREQVGAVAIAGTSSTVLLSDVSNAPLGGPLLYHDARAASVLHQIEQHAPLDSVTRSASSSLSKLCYLLAQADKTQAKFFSDQASWLAAMLTGRPGYADYHNALKLGYDVEALTWPGWLQPLQVRAWLPEVVAPGSDLGLIAPAVADKLGLPGTCLVRAGTTDSIAAFIASGARESGTAVTSLGSTLVLKLLSDTRIEAAEYGIYSHRFGKAWLAGGASNSGGAVLAKFFSRAQLAHLSREINPEESSGLDYYPLLTPAERFPRNDPNLLPRLAPRPKDDAAFLAGMLEGIAHIEAQGYALLQQLGASPVRIVLSAGGGALNPTWTAIRQRILGLPVRIAAQTEAAYGVALLARRGTDLLCYNDD